MTSEEQWRLDKWGKFSASEIHKLTIPGIGKNSGQMFGAGAMTYIKKIARQAYTLYNDRDDVETKAMANGKMDEAQSFQYLYSRLGLPELEYYGGANPKFFLYNEDSGASPDVLAQKFDGFISFGADLKNPTGDVHFEYLDTIRDDNDLRALCYEYWVQAQFCMMTFKCNLWLWCSHNEYFPPDDRMLIIEVPAHGSFQQNLDIRLKQASKIKWEEIAKRKNRHLLNQN